MFEKFLIVSGGVLGGYLFLVLLVNFLVKRFQKSRDEKRKTVLLSVRVSKENETGPIVAEQIFATLHGIYRDIPWWKTLFGVTNDRLSFEIANINQSIRFYIWTPVRLKNMIEGQIYAQYPDVEIEELDDYDLREVVEIAKRNVSEPNQAIGTSLEKVTASLEKKEKQKFKEISLASRVMGAEIEFTDPDVFPIKRFVQFEDKLTRVAVDPISGITAALSKMDDPLDRAFFQVVVRPLSDKWRTRFIKALRIVNKGGLMGIETLEKFYLRLYTERRSSIRWIFFPLYWFFGLQGLSAGMKGRGGISMSQQGAAPMGEDPLDEETSERHDRETPSGAAMDKVGKLLFETKIRVVYIPRNKNMDRAESKIREMVGVLKQFNIPHMNGFQIGGLMKGEKVLDSFKRRELGKSLLLNAEELATIYHLPNMTVQTPLIYWVRSKKLEPPPDLPTPSLDDPENFTMLGATNFRGMRREFGIKTLDRRRHIYVIGKTGMGKSTLLENMIFSDIQAGKGVAVIDPHGDLAEAVLNFVPSYRTNDVVIFDPSDRDYPVSFNMLETSDPSMNTIICSGMVGIFKKIYGESWGPRLEHILRNTILSLLEYPGTTMLGITRVLQDAGFRKKVIRKVQDPLVKSFWVNEFEKFDARQRIEAISPILNKVGQFLASPIIRNIVGQPKSAIDIRFAMDRKKIFVANLSKGKIGEDNSSLLGAMLITKFQLDAMSRANIPQDKRVDFYLYVDEFQNFATDSFATILSEARKYRLNLTMANQYIAQMADEVRDAVFGNVGTLLSFQVGFDDAEYFSQQYAEEVTANDLVSLSKYTAYMRLLIDGMPSRTFSLDALPPPVFEQGSDRVDKIIRLAREKYSTKREIVEDKIKRWSEAAQQNELPGGDKKFLKHGGGKK